MAYEHQGFDPSAMAHNLEVLADNPYPGRGIVLGVSEDGESAVQAYWVMGRSENSRNRVLVEDSTPRAGHEIVRTEAFDPTKVQDPSLIIYNAMRTADSWRTTHIVSNGDQTDTVLDGWLNQSGKPSLQEIFVDSLLTREFEPDAPNFTPRITGITYVPLVRETEDPGQHHYSIIKRNPDTGEPEHTFGTEGLDKMPDGTGICFHTYEGDGDPLPSFEGGPFSIPLLATAEETAEALWDRLDKANRVALVVKTINRGLSGEIKHHIINQLGE